MLATWLYLSISNLTAREQAGAIDSIVGTSRRRNADLDVTGALIFSGSRFAQFIEGPPKSVAVLRAAIENDSRHQQVTTLETVAMPERRFPAWSLAYSGRSTFVDLELQRIAEEQGGEALDPGRSLMMLLTEFSRTGGLSGF